MCGIVGLAGQHSAKVGATLVERMNQTIVHRGPDDAGVWSTDGFAFAMRRLSIIDLAGGHQPMWTSDGVGIVFNGEIYNYQRLRRELQQIGYQFSTQSDTEVVLNLYHRFGVEMVKRLEGMFAICLYDSRTRVIHLFRDRFGVKPLYYANNQGVFYFASEIKAILAGMPHRPCLNAQALHDYLTLRFIPSPESVWQDIYKLSPGCHLKYSLEEKTFDVCRYWSLHFQSEPFDTQRDYLSEFEKLFSGAVEKRLLASDVPVGVLLSGGLDSSAVSAAAVELGHRDFHTFTVAFDEGGEFDETDYAREVATHIGSQHHEVFINQQQFIDFLPLLAKATDEPLADLAGVPLYFVSELARREVKVVLSGEGSDELLAGYNFERIGRMLAQLQIVENILPARLLKLLTNAPLPGEVGIWLRLWGRQGWRNLLASLPYHMTLHWTESEKHALWSTSTDRISSISKIQGWYADAVSNNPIDQLQQVYSRQWLSEDLLMKADKLSMAASLEVREPFLDHSLAEWGARLPLEWRIGDWRTGYKSKRILRAYCDSRLPKRILNRKKRGFQVPAYRWLAGPLRGWAEHRLFRSQARLIDIFDLTPVRPVFYQAVAGDTSAAHKIWLLLVLEHWLEVWN